MRIFGILTFLGLSCFASALEQKSNLTASYADYTNFAHELLYSGDTTLSYQKDNLTLNSKIDFFYSNHYIEKRELNLEELYLTQEYENRKFELGKVIKYWGELEGYNVADIFNQKNYLFDPFDKNSKIGSYTLNLTQFKENDSFEVGFTLYPSDIKYPATTTPYSVSAQNYDEDLQSDSSKYNPTTYLKYNFTTDKNIQSDTKIILLNGYDTKRYFIPLSQTKFAQHLYKVDKFLVLSNIVYKETILKFEGAVTAIKEDKNMSDYGQFSFGLEHGFYDMGGVDLTLYGEYYKYLYKDDSKVKNVDMSELYNDDIFFACKINLNDSQESQIKSGVLYDKNNSEKIFKMELQRRVEDGLVFKGEILRIFPKEKTILTNIGVHTRTILALTYTF